MKYSWSVLINPFYLIKTHYIYRNSIFFGKNCVNFCHKYINKCDDTHNVKTLHMISFDKIRLVVSELYEGSDERTL